VITAPENLDEYRVRYEGIYPALQQTAKELQVEFAKLLRSEGLAIANVEARAKEVASFVKKLIQKGYDDPWEDVTDKIGVRITTVNPADVSLVVEALVGSEFEMVKIEDKREQLDPAQLGYLATHIDARFSPRNDLAPSDCRCEVQIRTAAESAWAYAAHDLMYKAPVPGDPVWQRGTYRLLALVELFDCEIKRLQETIMADPNYAEGRVLEALEREFFRLTAIDYDRELSRDIIGPLLTLLTEDELAAPGPMVHEFVEAHQEKLANLYRQYLLDHRHVLMSQPESLLIFQLLEKDRYTLSDTWQAALPSIYLERLSEVWGIPVDLSADS
jgi:ppGpp synthetase/RelA/SpoT-type nucleotidyltranferase